MMYKQTGKSWDQLFGEVSSCKKAGGIRRKSQLMDGVHQGGFCALDDDAFDRILTVWIPVEIAQELFTNFFHSDWFE